MELLTVAGFIILGLILIIVEIIFVPGTTFVGILGFVFAGYGIFLSFDYYGNDVGFATLGISFIFSVGIMVYAFKYRAWERFASKGTIEGTVNDEKILQLTVGDEGETVSSLKPIGKAAFNDEELEVRSLGEFIEEKQPIKVIEINNKRIVVAKV